MFIAALFTVAKMRKLPNCSLTEDCNVYISQLLYIHTYTYIQWRYIPTYNGIILSHKKEWNNAICSTMNTTRDYHTQFSSVAQPCPALHNPTGCSTPRLSVHHQLPEFTQTHWVSDAIQLSHPLSSPSPPDFNLSQHLCLSNESALRIRWPKYWSFSFNISPSNEHSGLISFRMDWLYLLAVQGSLKSLLQQHSSKASVLPRSAFFIVQFSHTYMTTGKTVALTRQTFVGKVVSLFNMLSRWVITFLPRSKHLLISWLQSPSAVILEPPKIKSATVSPSICHEVMGLNAMIFVFWMLSFKPPFLSFSLSSRGSLVLLHFLP